MPAAKPISTAKAARPASDRVRHGPATTTKVTNRARAAARPTSPASPRMPSATSCECGWRTGKLKGGAAACRASGMLPGPMPKTGFVRPGGQRVAPQVAAKHERAHVG